MLINSRRAIMLHEVLIVVFVFSIVMMLAVILFMAIQMDDQTIVCHKNIQLLVNAEKAYASAHKGLLTTDVKSLITVKCPSGGTYSVDLDKQASRGDVHCSVVAHDNNKLGFEIKP